VPRLIGDQQRRSYPNLAGMMSDMARSLEGADDPRYQRFWGYEPKTPRVRDWWANDRKTSVLVGANKSFKTTIGMIKAVMVFTGIIPPSLKGIYPHELPQDRPRHVRVIVADFTKHWPETIKPLLTDDSIGVLPKSWANNYDPNQHIFYGPDGSWLSIFAADPQKNIDPRSLRGPAVDHTYIDERNHRVVWTESLTRIFPNGPKTVDLGYCPQDGKGCWTYKDIYGQCYNLTTDQKLPESEQNPAIYVERVTMDDNPYITEKDKADIIASCKPYEIAYRVNGLYSDRTDDPFFDMDILWKWEQEDRCYRGLPVKLVEDEIDVDEGVFKAHMTMASGWGDETDPIWEVWKKPQHGHKYISVLDSAEGKPLSDFQVHDIWDATDKFKPYQVAQLIRRQVKPDKFAIQGLCMSTIYGGEDPILFAFEQNNTCGGIVLDKCRAYQNPYLRTSRSREIVDDTDLLGWHSDWVNKPAACQEADTMIQEWERELDSYCGIRSVRTLEDMRNFQDRIERDKNGISKRVLGARAGSHDDCVTVLWIMAYIIRIQYELLTPSAHPAIIPHDEDRNYVSELERDAERATRKSGERLAVNRAKPSLSALAQGRSHGRST